jgi:glycosyltransferase involved in cell wall biosynthesis/MoaA/NifB/PqqE/SkfB family radical SAM enzyme
MKILQIIHGYPPTYNAGSEVYTQSICTELSKHHNVTVFTREDNPYIPDFSIRYEKISENLSFCFVNMAQAKDGFRHAELDERFTELLQKTKPDIAHIGHLNHLSTGIVDELNKKKIPIVFTLHDFWLMCPRGQFLQRNTDGLLVWQLCGKQENQSCAEVCYKPYFSGLTPSIATMVGYEFSHKSPHGADALNDLEYWTNWIDARMTETKGIIDKVDLFIAPSKYLMDRFVNDFAVPGHKILYLDYGFPTEYLTLTQKSKAKKEFTFGYIGTHIPAKGLNLLIEAFKKTNVPATLKIFGRHDGQSTTALKRLAAESVNSIEFAGEYINHNLANDVFSKIDCIVVPSIWGENSPLVIHEAQACKIPVITADFGGMKEYVQHQVNGLLFEHRNTDSLTAQLNFALHNPEVIRQLGSRGYLYSDDGKIPSIQDHCKELVKLYQLVRAKKLWRLTLDTNPEDCNLHCLMCEEHSPYSTFIPNLEKTSGLRSRRMDPAVIERIFREAKALDVKEIIPSTMGEPLLYKGIRKIFELSEQYDIKINLTTNGTFPGMAVEEWAKLIVPQTSDIKISWNGASPEIAEGIMTGLNFNKTLEKVRILIAYRNDHFKKTGYYCSVTFQVTFLTGNMHELSGIIRLAAELDVDRVKGHQAWIHFPEMQKFSILSSPVNIATWNECVKAAKVTREKFRRPNGEMVRLDNILPIVIGETQHVPEDYECPFLGKELWISALGKISPCCAPDKLREQLGDFGSINETSLAEVFRSEQYNELIMNYKTNELCRKCNMRRPASNLN